MSAPEIVDHGGVPASLAATGYRSVNRVAVAAALGVLVAIVALVLWLVLAPRASLAAVPARPVATPQPADAQQTLPDPPAESLGHPRTHPLFAPKAAPVAKATAAPQTTTTTATTVAYVQPQPATPPSAVQAVPRVKTDAEIAADARAARYETARAASSRMTLETQDAQAQRDLGGATTTATATLAAAPATAFVRDAHEAFAAGQSGEPGYIPATSRYEVAKGAIVACRLITTVDSTILGGIMLAQVVETVFDSATHRVPVIPQGTIVVGRADNALLGEARLASSWNEFDLPNGQRFFASANQGAGVKGEAGMSASVDTHAGRAFGHALVASLIRAGTGLANRSTTVIDIGGGQTTQQQPQGPTLHAYAGQLFNIVLDHDLPFDRYVAR
ncbi:MAG: hypothetical protein NVSMB21_25090 [Vulcanimicrobiaceae bacterium]